ncbi:MAG: response regulator [Myxococcales bacterium]|nr:response regulator [Myxococcales bacterium]
MTRNQAPTLESERDSARGCVLVVDDNQALRRAVAKMLRRAGHEVMEAESGTEAAELIACHAFDVVVSDIAMPDMDGIELLELTHRREPDLPVLLMTGMPKLETAVKAVEYGAFEYLVKPVEPAKLEESVARAIRQHQSSSARRQALESAERLRDAHPPSSPSQRGDCPWTGELLAGRYRVGRLIGAGGMGSVYEAVREDLGHMRVAIKVLHAGVAAHLELVQRFRREAELVAAIEHPNIVKILDFDAAASGPTFLVMELLHGLTLGQAIKREGRLPAERVAFIASQVLGALGAAHAAHVIHRDLKPDNVFLMAMSGLGDIVKLLDFGAAKLLAASEERKLTQTGVVLGTPAYMAPEYARGGSVDERGDIYGVGCVMYEALTGQEPFVAENYNALLFLIQDQTAHPLAALRPELPPGLIEVVDRAMAKDPAERFQSAQAMADALAPWVVPESSPGRTVAAPDEDLGTAPTLLTPSGPPAR